MEKQLVVCLGYPTGAFITNYYYVFHGNCVEKILGFVSFVCWRGTSSFFAVVLEFTIVSSSYYYRCFSGGRRVVGEITRVGYHEASS